MDVSHLKIGHLPERIQGMVNDHLENRENPAKIVDWLNEFGPVQLMRARDFNYSKMTAEDLEEWRKFRGLALLRSASPGLADHLGTSLVPAISS